MNSCKFVKIEIYFKIWKANWTCKITDYVSIMKNSNLWNKLLWYVLFCFCNIATVSLSRASSKIKRVLGTSWKLFVCPAWIFPLKLVWSTICTQKIFFFFFNLLFCRFILNSYKTLKKKIKILYHLLRFWTLSLERAKKKVSKGGLVIIFIFLNVHNHICS